MVMIILHPYSVTDMLMTEFSSLIITAQSDIQYSERHF